MRSPHRRRNVAHRVLAICSLLLPLLAHAGVQLSVDGVADPLKTAAISGVELSQYATRDVSGAQVRRLYERAPDQVKTALEPYGYYDAIVTGELRQVGANWRVTLHVKPGEPVKVTAVDVQLDKDGCRHRTHPPRAARARTDEGQHARSRRLRQPRAMP